MYRLQVKTHFDAAHYIKDYEGKCRRMHGHRWEVEVVLEGEALDHMNILMDFSEVKKTLKGYLDVCFDHYVLNETLAEPNVTAEYLAKKIFEDLHDLLALPGHVKIARVTVWESPDCCVKYYGERP